MFFTYWYNLYAKPTPSEQAIEPAIAALGRRYRAQHPFPGLRHICDFALLDDKIIIEVDGASHQTPGQRFKDAKNTLALARLGWRVVRCTNEEAVAHPHLTVAQLLEHATNPPDLAALEASLAALPVPPPRVSKRRKSRQPPAPKASRASARKAAKPPAAQ